MANTDRPNGFRPVGTLSGTNWNGKIMKIFSPSEDVFMGDLVEITTTGEADGDGAFPTVGRFDASDVPFGVVVGWQRDPAALDRLYHESSSTYWVLIAHTPDLVCEVQSDDGTPTFASVGANFNVVVAAGSTTTGVSNMELDGDTGNTTNTLPLKLIGMVDRPDNDPTSANMKCLVTFNAHVLKGDTGSAGLA